MRYTVATVDDDFNVRQALESLLEAAGYVASGFASGDDLLASNVLDELACLISDVRMPGFTGLELQRKLRANRPSLPVIFVTAHADVSVRSEALAGGAIGFLLKPIDAAELLDLVAHASALSAAPRP